MQTRLPYVITKVNVYIHKHRKNAGRKIPHKQELESFWSGYYILLHIVSFMLVLPYLRSTAVSAVLALREKETRTYHLQLHCGLLSAS